MTPSPTAPPKRSLPKPRAILFDWDNTLVDSWPVIHDALNVTLEAFGHTPWTMDETRARVRKSMRDSFPALFGDRWQAAGEVFYERYGAIHADMIEPAAGAETALEWLTDAGIYLGVVSNKKGDFLRQEATRLGWDRFFGRLVGALDAARDKPAPDPVEMALTGSGVSRGGSVWFVGDADIDLECALNAACIPVLLRREPPAPGEFASHPPAWHCAGFEALCNTVKGL